MTYVNVKKIYLGSGYFHWNLVVILKKAVEIHNFKLHTVLKSVVRA